MPDSTKKSGLTTVYSTLRPAGSFLSCSASFAVLGLIVLLGGISIFGGRGTILGLVLAVCVIATLQDALTLDLMSPQDQNVVIGALLVASVILPNASAIYARARTRLASAAARRASRRLPAPGSSAP